ncbi:hypothetical protein FQP88_09045 [Vibrio atlanticus]|nr:hypothetical protein FQP88_09045 [Vibrio atlanticus]
MNSIIKNMPQGNERNKIEYLAENIHLLSGNFQLLDETQQTILLGLAGIETTPKNLLTNPNFSMSGMSEIDATSFNISQWHDQTNVVRAVQPVGAMAIGDSRGGIAPYGWGLEVAPATVDDGYYSSSVRHGTDSTFPIEKEYNAEWKLYGRKVKFIAFNVFSVGFSQSTIGIGAGGYRKYSAYLSGRYHKANRFGVCKLNANGEMDSIVAEMPLNNDTAGMSYTASNVWLHNIELEQGHVYAFFVEVNYPSTSGQRLFEPSEAGVFENDAGEDIVPSMTSQRAMTVAATKYQIAKPTSAEMASGLTMNAPPYPCPLGIEKHLIFASTKTQGKEVNLAANALIATQSGYGHDVLISGDTGNLGHGDIRAHYSDTPLYLNFY